MISSPFLFHEVIKTYKLQTSKDAPFHLCWCNHWRTIQSIKLTFLPTNTFETWRGDTAKSAGKEYLPPIPQRMLHTIARQGKMRIIISVHPWKTVRVQDMTNWGKIWSWLLYHKRHPQQFQTVNHSADQSCGHGMEEISNTQSNTDPKQNKSLSFCPPRSQLTLPHSHYPVIFSTFYSTEHLLSLLPNTLENNYF